MKTAEAPSTRSPASNPFLPWREPLGLAALAGLALFFLATSWRKWPDPLVDFGRELYIPWRIAHGAILYRDVDDFYGPLSQYFNGGLFAVFGPGLMVLVTANLAVFAAILAAIYCLFRSAWGAGAAVVSSAIFIAVHGFSQYSGIGNYNYATPYSHEATHGLLVCLLLIVVLLRWVQQPTPLRSFMAGGLFGLTAVLKPEMMLAAALVTFTAVAIERLHRNNRGADSPSAGRPLGRALLPALRGHAKTRVRTSLDPAGKSASATGPPAVSNTLIIPAWIMGAVLPTAGFIAYFSAYLPWKEAAALACRGWLSAVATTRFTADAIQIGLLGLDRPWEHLWQHTAATFEACLIVAALGALASLADRNKRKSVRVLLAGSLAAGVLWLSFFAIAWDHIGRCLLGLTLIYIVVCTVSLIRGPAQENSQAPAARLLLAVLAAALMARMFLNGRIYQLGFYQAALASLLVTAVLVGEFPARLRMGPWGRRMAVAGALLLLSPGVVWLAAQSQQVLHQKTHPVAQGVDRFYAFTPKIGPNGAIVGLVSDWLREQPPGQTLLVLPEGEMINYLARMPSTVAPFFFYSAATSGGREEAIVNELQQRPPDWIVIVSRDLREYGIERYGEGPGKGEQILRWVADNYKAAQSVGGDPLDVRQRGGIVLRHTGRL